MYGESQRIVISPDRGKLIRYAALYLVLTPVAAFACAMFLSAALPPYNMAHPAVTILGVVLGLVAPPVCILTGALFLFTLYRVVVR